ncbi:monocarboxylate transporter 12-like [Glandiceps talaboti]
MGSGFGIFIIPPILHLLIEKYGWRGAFLVLSALNANICVFSILFKEPKTDVLMPSSRGLHGDKLANEENPSTTSNKITDTVTPVFHHQESYDCQSNGTKSANSGRNTDLPENETQSHGKKGGQLTRFRIKKLLTMFDLNLFRESGLFVLLFVSCFFQGLGHYMAVIYLLPRAESREFASSSDNTFLVSIMGIFSIIGRGVHGFILECKYITGWIYDATQNYDHVYYLAGISLCVGGFIILLMPCLKKVENRRRTAMGRGANRDECHENAAFDDKDENVNKPPHRSPRVAWSSDSNI